MQKRIAMIGGGNMAGALVAGLVAAGYPSHLIDVMDRNQTKCDRLHTEYAVNTHLTAGDWLKQAEVVVLAVKPQGLFDTMGGESDAEYTGAGEGWSGRIFRSEETDRSKRRGFDNLAGDGGDNRG